nr:tRNA pseudouridine(13) synthase TruD [Nannocystis pusilla]
MPVPTDRSLDADPAGPRGDLPPVPTDRSLDADPAGPHGDPASVPKDRHRGDAPTASDARARRGLSASDLERLREPPLQTADLPGVGGAIRSRPEDFRVLEVPAYDPDGRANAHVLLVLTKRGVGSEEAVAEVARQLAIPRAEVGLAGLKDKDAVTEQWISLPAAAAARLGQLSIRTYPSGQLTPTATSCAAATCAAIASRSSCAIRSWRSTRRWPAAAPRSSACARSAASTISTANSGSAVTIDARPRRSGARAGAAGPTSCSAPGSRRCSTSTCSSAAPAASCARCCAATS